MEALGARYTNLIRQLDPDAKRITDKMPSNFLWLGAIHAAFPNAKIIHCRRNPLDTCLSIHQTFFNTALKFQPEARTWSPIIAVTKRSWRIGAKLSHWIDLWK